MRLFMAILAGLFASSLLVSAPAQAQAGYKIRAGDVLRIEVLEDESLNRSVLVSPDGRIALPLAGAIPAAGRTIEAVQADIAAGLAANFATPPNVFVAIEQVADAPVVAGVVAEEPTISIYVVGEVARPGKLAVAPGTTVLQLFAEMGGFSNFAATQRIQLRRTDKASGKETIYTLNYKAMEAGTSKNSGAVVAEGDVILVPQRRLFE